MLNLVSKEMEILDISMAQMKIGIILSILLLKVRF